MTFSFSLSADENSERQAISNEMNKIADLADNQASGLETDLTSEIGFQESFSCLGESIVDDIENMQTLSTLASAWAEQVESGQMGLMKARIYLQFLRFKIYFNFGDSDMIKDAGIMPISQNMWQMGKSCLANGSSLLIKAGGTVMAVRTLYSLWPQIYGLCGGALEPVLNATATCMMN